MKHLLDVLKPHSIENGSPLKVEHISFIEERGNLMIMYTPKGASGKQGTIVSYTQLWVLTQLGALGTRIQLMIM